MIYIIFLLFTFGILVFAFYQWQYHMIFAPIYYRDGELNDEFEILSIKTDDGVELEGVVYEPKKPTSTLLFFAGRSHDAVGVIKKLASFYPNIRIITFNYRSYGRSEGVASEKNILNDGVKIAQLVQKNYGAFYILGYSLGSSVASYVASRATCRALFLVGAFDSIASVAKEKFVVRGLFPMMDLSNIFRYKFNNKEHLEKVNADTYLIASIDDETTYIQNARNLSLHVKNLVKYEELENLSHKDILWDEKTINIIKEVLE